MPGLSARDEHAAPGYSGDRICLSRGHSLRRALPRRFRDGNITKNRRLDEIPPSGRHLRWRAARRPPPRRALTLRLAAHLRLLAGGSALAGAGDDRDHRLDHGARHGGGLEQALGRHASDLLDAGRHLLHPALAADREEERVRRLVRAGARDDDRVACVRCEGLR